MMLIVQSPKPTNGRLSIAEFKTEMARDRPIHIPWALVRWLCGCKNWPALFRAYDLDRVALHSRRRNHGRSFCDFETAIAEISGGLVSLVDRWNSDPISLFRNVLSGVSDRSGGRYGCPPDVVATNSCWADRTKMDW